MKRKNLEQLRNKIATELESDLKKNRERLWQLQVDLKAGKVKNVREIRATKKTIAIIHTLLTEKAHVA